MNKLQELKQSAIESAEFRGHKMGGWANLDYHRHASHCVDCDKQALVNTHPRANEIDIAGEAVAIGCQD